MDWSVFLKVLAINELVVLVQFPLAWLDCLLTPRQMQKLWGRQGIPLLYHGAMPSDSIIISPLVAYLVAMHGNEWIPEQIFSMGLLGLIVCGALHHSWMKSKFPEAHMSEGTLLITGWVHAFYLWVNLSVIGLYYSGAMRMDQMPELCVVSGLLVLHVILANHAVLRWWKPEWYPGGPFLKDQGAMSATLGTAGVALVRISWLAMVGY